jgi:hypothetical protein
MDHVICAAGILAEVNDAWVSELLKTRGKIGRVAYRRVVHS